MGKGLDIMNKLGSAVDSYHKKGKGQVPEHDDIESKAKSPKEASQSLEDNSNELDHSDGQVTHHMDEEDLEDVLCPGCHDRLRRHLVAKSAGEKA